MLPAGAEDMRPAAPLGGGCGGLGQVGAPPAMDVAFV
jgi:hypothetical protein